MNRDPRELGFFVLYGFGRPHKAEVRTSKLLLPYTSLNQLKYSTIHDTLLHNYYSTLSYLSHLPHTAIDSDYFTIELFSLLSLIKLRWKGRVVI